MNERTSASAVLPDSFENGFSVAQTNGSGFTPNEPNVGSEKGNTTIRRLLGSYEIGAKIRKLRLRKKIGLVDLGKHTGLSASMLSQLENGKLVPTLATLARIAMVFDVGLDHFFTDTRRQRTFLVVRGAERLRFPDRPGSPNPGFFFECLAFSAQEKSLQAYLAEFPPLNSDTAPEHMHDGAEFFHVLEGTVIIRYQGEEHTLSGGDSVYFDSSEPHSYRGVSDPAAKAVVVTTPPRL